MTIHPTALIEDGAQIHPTADIGPYCVVGPNVEIGAGAHLMSHVVVQNHTVLGEDNKIHPFASVGGTPQDLKYEGEAAKLIIGNNNVIREGATLNIGTSQGGGATRVGNDCLLMAYAHVAHDCILGDGVILANSVALAGHVTLGDHVILGGLAGVHQFCRIGRNAFVAAGGMAAQDVLPFSLVQGDRAQHVGINIIGLKRTGWDKATIMAVRTAFKRIFHSNGTREEALVHTEQTLAKECAPVREMCEFIRSAKRGICAARVTNGSGSDEA